MYHVDDIVSIVEYIEINVRYSNATDARIFRFNSVAGIAGKRLLLGVVDVTIFVAVVVNGGIVFVPIVGNGFVRVICVV